MTIINDASWIDVFDGGQAFFRPSTNSVVIQRDGRTDEVRPVYADYLYLRCCLVNGDVWTCGQQGTSGHLIVTYPGGTIDLGPTFGQQVCAIAFVDGVVRVAYTDSLTTWRDVSLATDGHTISINGYDMTGTTQGMLDWFPAADPLWTDQHRSVVINGVTMLLAVTRTQPDGTTMTVGQPVTGPPQQTGVANGTRPTSLFMGLGEVVRWPELCAQADGTFRVCTSLAGNQAAVWVGAPADLPAYDPVTPIIIPDIPAITSPCTIGPFVQAAPGPETDGEIRVRTGA